MRRALRVAEWLLPRRNAWVPRIILHDWHGNDSFVELILDLTDIPVNILRATHYRLKVIWSTYLPTTEDYLGAIHAIWHLLQDSIVLVRQVLLRSNYGWVVEWHCCLIIKIRLSILSLPSTVPLWSRVLNVLMSNRVQRGQVVNWFLLKALGWSWNKGSFTAQISQGQINLVRVCASGRF